MASRYIGEATHRVCDDAVKHKGLVVTQSGVSAASKVCLVDADKEKPYGVTVESTEDPLNPGTYLANKEIAILREGEVKLVLASDNAAIEVGDPIMAVADGAGELGVIDKLTIREDSVANYAADIRALVGIAEEAAAQNAGATYGTMIRVKLMIQR